MGAGPDERLLADDGARVDRGVDADLHVVPHDHAELSEPLVDLDPPPHHLDRRLVEAEVRHLRARAEVAALAEDAVPDVVLVRHVCGGHQDRILDFAGASDLRVRPDRRRRTDVAVRPNLGSRADDRRAFDVRAFAYQRVLFDRDLSHQGRARVDVAVVRALEGGEEGRIRPEEVPRPPDVDPISGNPEPVDVLGPHQGPDRVRDLVFAPRRLRGLVNQREDVLVEDVDARVDQVRLRPARFLFQAHDLAVVHLDDTERPRIRDLRERHHGTPDGAVVGDHRRERVARHDDVPVHAQERTVDVGPHAAQRVRRAEPLRLLLVRDREAQPLAVSEALPNPVALPPDQDRRLRDPGGPQCLERVAQERLARHRQKRLGKIGREGTHPSSLAGREDDCLHAAAPFALDRTVEYISFALASSRDSASTRIFGSVPEKRTSAHPSSNWRRQPSTVVTSEASDRIAESRWASIAPRLEASYAIAPRITGYLGIPRTSEASGCSATSDTRRAAAYTPSGQYEVLGKIQVPDGSPPKSAPRRLSSAAT